MRGLNVGTILDELFGDSNEPEVPVRYTDRTGREISCEGGVSRLGLCMSVLSIIPTVQDFPSVTSGKIIRLDSQQCGQTHSLDLSQGQSRNFTES